jgi:cyclohexyl-isocyanide hydratase
MTAVSMLLFPRMTQLDLTGPYEVLARMPDARIALVAEAREPVMSETGFTITPTATFDDAPPCDILFVPGGPGVDDAMLDLCVLDFVRNNANAAYITSVCTGALILGAAGLLDGYSATTHWTALEFLPRFGARPVAERVVVDRNRITGGGVTSGVDFALRLVAEIHGAETAKQIQLMIEYYPHPPFASGSPNTAEPEIVERVRALRTAAQERRRAAVERAALLG